MAARERVQLLQIDVKLGGQKVDSAKKHALWAMRRGSNNSGSNSNRAQLRPAPTCLVGSAICLPGKTLARRNATEDAQCSTPRGGLRNSLRKKISP